MKSASTQTPNEWRFKNSDNVKFEIFDYSAAIRQMARPVSSMMANFTNGNVTTVISPSNSLFVKLILSLHCFAKQRLYCIGNALLIFSSISSLYIWECKVTYFYLIYRNGSMRNSTQRGRTPPPSTNLPYSDFIRFISQNTVNSKKKTL